MATQSEKLGGPMPVRGGPDGQAREKQKDYQELCLFLALIALAVWALFTGLRMLDWPAISHTFKVLLAIVG